MTRHRFTGILGATAVAALALTACSTGDPGSDGEISGTLQIITGSAAGSDAGFAAVNEAFEAAYPDVTVEYTPVANEYATVLSTRLTAGNVDLVGVAATDVVPLPDYVVNGSASTGQLAASNGQFYDLAGEDFMQRINPSVLDVMTADGKQFALPLGLTYFTGVYYNASMFTDLGIEVPTTLSEFVAACETIEATGVACLGIGGKDGWPAGLPMAAAVQGSYPTLEDREAFDRGLWEGTATFDDPAAVDVLSVTETLYGFAEDNFAGVGYSEVPGLFARGEVAMVSDGTWNLAAIESTEPDFEFGYFPIPTSENPDDNRYLGGKIDTSLAALADGPNLPAALAYLDFISDPANYSLFLEPAGYVPVVDGAEVSPFLQGIAPYTEVFSPAWDQVWHPNAAAGPAGQFNVFALPPFGTSTPQQAAEAAAVDWALGLEQ